MATIDKTTNQANVPPIFAGSTVYVVKQRIDLNAIPGLAASDVIKVFNLPEGCILLGFGCKVVKPALGTALTLTFGSANGGTVAGTGDGKSTAGTIQAATLTDPKIPSKLSNPSPGFEWLQQEMGSGSNQPYLTVSPTTVTAITDFGVQDYYAIIADLTGVVARDPASTRVLSENSNIAGLPVV